MSSIGENIQDLDQFLAQLSEGEQVSSGSFSISAEKMLQKLAKAVIRQESWIVKLVQLAVTAEAGYLIAKFGRNDLKFQILTKHHLDVAAADRVLQETQRTRAHHHLLLCLVWLGQTPNLQHARVRWSTSESVEQIEITKGEFECSTISLPEESPHRFLEVTARRSPSSLVQRLFGKTDYSNEIRILHTSTYLAPLNVILDNRTLHSGLFDPKSAALQLYDRPGSTKLRDFEYPRRLFGAWNKEDRQKHKLLSELENKCSRATAYVEVIRRQKHSHLHWVLDGAIIQVDRLNSPIDRGDCSFLLFASAEGLTTDISTLSLTDSDEILERRQDRALWDWCQKVYTTLG